MSEASSKKIPRETINNCVKKLNLLLMAIQIKNIKKKSVLKLESSKKMIRKMKRFTFAEFANDCWLCFDFGPDGIRFFRGNKKRLMEILVPLLLFEFVKAVFHGFAQNNIFRFYLLDFITTLNKCKTFRNSKFQQRPTLF